MFSCLAHLVGAGAFTGWFSVTIIVLLCVGCLHWTHWISANCSCPKCSYCCGSYNSCQCFQVHHLMILHWDLSFVHALYELVILIFAYLLSLVHYMNWLYWYSLAVIGALYELVTLRFTYLLSLVISSLYGLVKLRFTYCTCCFS